MQRALARKGNYELEPLDDEYELEANRVMLNRMKAAR